MTVHSSRRGRSAGGAEPSAVRNLAQAADIARSDNPDDLRLLVGDRLKFAREQLGLSTRALALRAGVTSGFISQIENGHVMPSVVTLVRLTRAMDIQIGELFAPSRAPDQILHSEDRPEFTYAEWGLRDELISSDPTGRLELLISHVAPGGGTAEAYTHGAQSELVLVLKGQIDLTLGDQVLHLRTGDSVTFAGDIPHGYANRGIEGAELLWAMTPATY